MNERMNDEMHTRDVFCSLNCTAGDISALYQHRPFVPHSLTPSSLHRPVKLVEAEAVAFHGHVHVLPVAPLFLSVPRSLCVVISVAWCVICNGYDVRLVIRRSWVHLRRPFHFT